MAVRSRPSAAELARAALPFPRYASVFRNRRRIPFSVLSSDTSRFLRTSVLRWPPLRRTRSQASSIVSSLEANWNGEGESGADFIDGMTVGERMAEGDIEGELVVNSPDQSDEPGDRLFEAELFLIKELRNRPYLPLEWAFNDGANKNIGMMLSRQQGFDIEMNRSPIPALRDDAGPACANAAIAGAVRQQHTEFRSYAWSTFILKNTRHHNVLEECTAHAQVCGAGRHQRRFASPFENRLPSFAQADIHDRPRRNQGLGPLLMLKTSRLQFDLELSGRHYGSIRAVERPIGEGGARACCNTKQD